jgi:hypothetical protein
MKDLSEWLTEQNLADLARFASRPPEELRKVIVTDVMTEAAMDYIQSLYDPLLSTHLLEEVFRIMAVLQPKDQAGRAATLSLSQR